MISLTSFNMKKYPILLLFTVSFFSCKKNCAKINDENISETHWDLFYKYNSTFTFFAQSKLYFKSDNTVQNFRSADTTEGSWSQNNSAIELKFTNGEQLNGFLINTDSLSGTSKVAGNTGVWYAIKK